MYLSMLSAVIDMTDAYDETKRKHLLMLQTTIPKGHCCARTATRVSRYGRIVSMSAAARDTMQSLVLPSRCGIRRATAMVNAPPRPMAVVLKKMMVAITAATAGCISGELSVQDVENYARGVSLSQMQSVPGGFCRSTVERHYFNGTESIWTLLCVCPTAVTLHSSRVNTD